MITAAIDFNDVTDEEIDAMIAKMPEFIPRYNNPRHYHTPIAVLETEEFTIYRCECGKKEFTKKEKS